MLQQDTTNTENQNGMPKLVYGSPILVCYGKVGDLTQAGTGKSAEGSDTTNTLKKPTVSDPLAKENIVRIGTHPYGMGLYLFDYKPEFQAEWGYGRQFGVMADEVETVMPEAVVHSNGYKTVDYAMLGIAHSIH